MAEQASRPRRREGILTRRRMILTGGVAATVPLVASSRAVAAPTPGLVTLRSPVRVFDSRDPSSVLGGGSTHVICDIQGYVPFVVT